MEGRAKKLKVVSVIGFIIFVWVQLPITSSWSGLALASIFKMRIIEVLWGIVIESVVAGAIILCVSMHVANGISIEILLVALDTFSMF